MLPHIIAQNRVVPLRQRIILVRRRYNLQPAAFEDQPAPARSELLRRRLVERLLEVLKRAEVRLDLVRNRARRFAATMRLHDLPEHRMVHMPAAVVLDHLADVLRNARQILQQLIGRLLAQLRMLLYRPVQVRHIGLVVLVVVQLHGRFVDGGLKRRVVIGQRG